MNFLFLLGSFNKNILSRISSVTKSVWGEIKLIEEKDFLLLYPKSDSSQFLVNTPEYIGNIDGWAGDCNMFNPQTSIENIYSEISHEWPVISEGFSGCFSGVYFEKARSRLKIFSDLSGIYPLYYSNTGKLWIGGTSQIIIGRFLNSEIDPTGMIEMISPPYYSTLGTRTLLQNVYQVLPGELLEIHGNVINRKFYDNTLFGEPISGSVKQQAENLWEIIKSEVETCMNGNDVANLGMSGGWDSRLIAGALQSSCKDLTFYTYGLDVNEYEAQIAKKCSKLLHAKYQFCSTYSSYFPDYDRLLQNLLLTESPYVTSWFPVLEYAPKDKKEIFFLGDMFEAISGKSISSLTSRKSRRARFLQPSKSKDLLQKATPKNFNSWKNSKILEYSGIQLQQLDKIEKSFFDQVDLKMVKENQINDFSTLFNRIENHNFSYSILYDELFGWYLRGRSISRQFLCLKQNFTPLAPTMGFRTIRYTSRIDPIKRADGILLHEIQKLQELRTLSSLPSAAIPFIPSYYPVWLKNIFWGARSMIDQKLINRAIVTQNTRARLRLLPSENLIILYNHPNAKMRTQSYFINSPINGNHFEELVRLRASLQAWPLINTDIMGPANAAMLIKLIKNQESFNG